MELGQIDFSCKAIAMDLDGTAFLPDSTLSERTQAALRSAIELGIQVIPVTGRPFDTVPACIRDFEGIQYVISSNGAGVYDLQSGKKLHGWTLKPADVRAIARSIGHYFMEGYITYEAFVDGVAYGAEDYVARPIAYGVPAAAANYVHTTRRPVKYIIDFLYAHASELDCIDVILKETGLFGMISRQLVRDTECIYITSSSPYRMEISHGEASKVTGLSYVLNLLGIRQEETIAFGDGDNDAEMLSWAGRGVAMGNATADCRASADLVCKANVQDGLAEVLEKIVT